eukprot:7080696-Alexandrium_andersonii.AAC.1
MRACVRACIRGSPPCSAASYASALLLPAPAALPVCARADKVHSELRCVPAAQRPAAATPKLA